MSTKIYNGYETSLTMEELLPKLREFGVVVKAKATEIFRRSLTKEAVKLFDHITEDKTFKQVIEDMYEKCRTDLNKLAEYERAMGLVEIDLREITELWDKLDYIKDYHYQNQSDRPKGIKASDWKRREKNWDIALGGDGWGVPMENSYSYTFHSRCLPSRFGIGGLNNINPEYIPADDKRKKWILHDKMWKEWAETNFPDPSKKLEVSDYMKWAQDFNKSYEAGEYAEALDKIILKSLTPPLNSEPCH